MINQHTTPLTAPQKRALTKEIKATEEYIKDMQSTRKNNEIRWWYLGDKISIYHVNIQKTYLITLKNKRNET